MDLLKWIRTWISLWCYIDFSKLLHRFVKLGTCFSRPLPNKPSWSFTNVLKLNHWLKKLNEVLFSQYVMLYNHHITLQYITLLTAFSASYTGLPGLYPLCPFSATWPKVERMIDSVDLTLNRFKWLIFQLVWSIVIQLIYVKLIYVSPPSPSTSPSILPHLLLLLHLHALPHRPGPTSSHCRRKPGKLICVFIRRMKNQDNA